MIPLPGFGRKLNWWRSCSASGVFGLWLDAPGMFCDDRALSAEGW